VTDVLHLRRAAAADIDTLLEWRVRSAAYLRERYGTDQWSTPYPRERLEAWAAKGAMWMAALEPAGDPVATITMDSVPEPGLWHEREQLVDARYLSKLNVCPDPRYRNRGIGERMMRWCIDRAAAQGAAVMRIDVWTSNTALHRYYERFGFEYVRTVEGPNSGYLMQAPARAIPDPGIALES
jgi:GNAT superfamily N-acetyltransferase